MLVAYFKDEYMNSKEINIIYDCYTLPSPSVFSLAKRLILEISALAYKYCWLVSYLAAENWLICRLCTQFMISNNSLQQYVCRYFLQNSRIIKQLFKFCDILNNQGLGKCYQPQPITLTSTLIIPDITKTSSNNNCLISWSQKPHPIYITINVSSNQLYFIMSANC